MMDVLAGLYVLIHGLIHLIGVVVFWQLAEIPDIEYTSKLFFKRIEVGATGARIFGLLWLVATLALAVSAYGVVADTGWMETVLLLSTLFSLALCIAGLKDTVFGIVANVIVVVALFMA